MKKLEFLLICCYFAVLTSPVFALLNSQGAVQKVALNKVGEIDVGKTPFIIRKSQNILIAGDSGSGSSPGNCISPDANGLSVIDISDPSNPQILDQFYDGGQPHGIIIEGNTVFLADHCDGLEIYDVTDPTNITEIGQFPEFQLAHDLEIKGDLAYVADYRTGLKVLNVNDPTNITLVANYTDTGPIYQVQIINDIAYVSHSRAFEGNPDYNLILLDINDPTNITEIAKYDIKVNSITNAGEIAYIATDNAGLLIYNISNPINLLEIGSYTDVGRLMDLALKDDLVFATDFERGGLTVFDVSDPKNPQNVSRYYSGGQSLALDLDDDFAYITNYPSGLVEIIQHQETNSTNSTSGFGVSTLLGILILVPIIYRIKSR